MQKGASEARNTGGLARFPLWLICIGACMGVLALVGTFVCCLISAGLVTMSKPLEPPAMWKGIIPEVEEGRFKMGEEAPDLVLEDIEGRKISLREHRGRVVLLNFWAIWCKPCLWELPHLQEIHEEFKDEGLVVLTVCQEPRGRGPVKALIEKEGYTFTVLVDSKLTSFRYGIRGIPRTFLIDKKGIVRYDHLGYGPGMKIALINKIKRLLEEE